MIGIAKDRFGVGEAFAIYLLRSLDQFKEACIVQILNEREMGACKALVGVGDRFDPPNNLFSHHESHYNESMHSRGLIDGHNTKLSTGGQVYATYGAQLLRQRHPERYATTGNKLLPLDFRRFYQYFVEVVDSCIFIEPLDYPTPEKEKLVSAVSHEIAVLTNQLAPHRNPDLPAVAETCAARMGQLFETACDWYFGQYVVALDVLQRGFRSVFEVDESGWIVLCDYDFSQVNFDGLFEKTLKRERKKFGANTYPLIIITQLKSFYRVESILFGQKIDNLLFPREWMEGAVKEPLFPREWMEGAVKEPLFPSVKPTVNYVSDLLAITDSAESALKLAKDLVGVGLKKRFVRLPRTRVSSPQVEEEEEEEVKIEEVVRVEPIEKPVAEEKSATRTSSPVIYCVCQDTENKMDQEMKVEAVEVEAEEEPSEHPGDEEKSATTPSSPTTPADNQMDQEVEQPSAAEGTPPVNNTPLNNTPTPAPTPTTPVIQKDDLTHYPILVVHPGPLNQPPQREWASVAIHPADLSLSALDGAMRRQYKDLPDYKLCLSDGSAVVSNAVTEQPTFWALLFRSAEVPVLFTRVEAVPPSSPAGGDVVAGGETLGIQVGKWGVGEVLAATIILNTPNHSHLKLGSTQSKDCAVKLGPSGYHDHHHRYTSGNCVSLADLDILNSPHRLSSAGIAFALHGMDSITHLLDGHEGNFLSPERKLAIFRRIYARLILPIDQLGGSCTTTATDPTPNWTPEADLLRKGLEPLFRPAPLPGGGKAKELKGEEVARLRLAIHYGKQFYKKLVLSLGA